MQFYTWRCNYKKILQSDSMEKAVLEVYYVLINIFDVKLFVDHSFFETKMFSLPSLSDLTV